MEGVRNNASMEIIENAFDDLHSGKKAVVIVLVHKPGCPHCRNYYSQFNELCERLPGLCGDKGSALSIDFDEASDEMQDETDFVPRVILSESKGDGTSRKMELDETTRRIDALIPMIEQIMREGQHDISQPTMISLSPMVSEEPKKPKKTKGTKKEKKGKKGKKDQKGRGFVEAALATAILGGGANIANHSATVKKYLKQAEGGIIGLSKASSDLAKGSLKVLTEQDMMKKLANVTKSLTTKRRKTQKRQKRKRSKTQKARKTKKSRGTRKTRK
jgi:thiol-disulfide isomerase/thioredoxin